MSIDYEKHAKTSDSFYILKANDYFVMIAGNDILLDNKIEVYKKIKLEDEISFIASSLKE